MGQIFQSFIAGNREGTEQRETRARRNALEEAGHLYSTGNADGAENVLVAAGLTQEAAATSALGENRRRRTNRTAISNAMTRLGPNASPQDVARAGATASLEVGDPEQWAQFEDYVSRLTQQDRENQSQRAQWLGTAAASLMGVPAEQRVAQARALLSNSPYANDPHMQALVDDDASDLSDTALQSAANNALSAADILAGRERQQRYAVQDRQFQQQLNMQERNYQRSMNPDATPLSNSDRRGVSNQYNQAIDGAMESLGILRPSLSYARLAVTNNGDTTNIDGVNSRSSDVALLRAAARAQTGPGVLTESEVFSTLSPSLQNDLNRNVAYLDIGRNGITPQDRLALAQFVMQSARNTQRDAWDLYENTNADWGSRPNAPTFEPPRIPHPEDEGRLQAAERGGARVGQEYVANGGRTYRFLAPGSWELSRMGGTRDMSQPQLVDPSAGRENAVRWAPGQPIPQEAIRRVRDGEASVEEFSRTFGVSEAEARRLTGATQEPPVYRRPDGPMTRG